MPTKFKMPSEGMVVRGSTDDDFEERYVNSFLKDIDAQFSLPRIEHLGPGSFAGPCRFLEYAQPIDIYYQYSVHEDTQGRKPAAFSTFMRIYHQVFGKYLKFRDKREHAQCNVCASHRRKIKLAKTKSTRVQFVKEYSMHVLQQWMDRQIYWKMRALSQRFFATSVHSGHLQDNIYSSCLTCIMDGMDQSKLRTPRFQGRISKMAEALFRPTLHLAAVWIHGKKIHLPISDESLKKDSTTQLEQLARALSDLVADVGSGGLPLGCMIQQDNCFREGKNQFVLLFALILTIAGAFRWTGLSFLRTGHSHEDVDQIFGQLSRLLRGKSFCTPEGLIRILQTAAGTPGQSRQIRGTAVAPYKLDETACWKPFTQQVSFVLKGLRFLTGFIHVYCCLSVPHKWVVSLLGDCFFNHLRTQSLLPVLRTGGHRARHLEQCHQCGGLSSRWSPSPSSP